MLIRMLVILLVPLTLAACGTSPQNCSQFNPGTSDFRLCRAEQGSKEYQFRVGMEHFVNDDFRLARDWFIRSSRDEYDTRTEELELNMSRAGAGYNHTTREATEDGNEAAAFMMARIYGEGLGVPQDQNRSKTYEKLAGNMTVEVEEIRSGHIIRVKKLSTLNLRKTEPRSAFELYSFQIIP